jgi:hypothetical protein
VSESEAGAALAQISSMLDGLFDMLAPIASGFSRVAGLDQPVHEDLIDFRGAISDVISGRGPIGGAGVIVAPGVLADTRYWMEWWWAVPDHDPEALRVNLEPTAPDFFDYTTADWYVTPERSGSRHIAGPYVDYVCTNEYAITLAQPVRASGRFVGVAALDVTVAGFEGFVLPLLRTVPRAATLANAAGRVIASTSSSVWPGQRMPESAGDRLCEASQFGWQIFGESG